MIDFMAQAEAMRDDLIRRRRDLHQYPELAFEEKRTAGIVAEDLHALGLEVQPGIGRTGVIGMLEGRHDGPTVLYRADMDALPIQELNEVEYISKTPGVMHACGHDGHVSIGLGVARLLSQYRDTMHGRVKFVFQPGEEGAGGALAMISDGVLDDPAPEVCLGMHLWTPLPIGTVGVASGAVMSGSSIFTLTVRGKGGHAALPHTTVDPVACSGQLIGSLETIVGRRMDAMAGAVVLSVTGVRTSTHSHNVIPESVEIKGTFRTFNAYTSEMLEQHIRDVSQSVCESMYCTVEIAIRHLTIPLVNDHEVTMRARHTFSQMIRSDSLDDSARTMASEDFSYFIDEIPGAYFFVGASNAQRGLIYGHHHPRFDFDEDALPLGVALMSAAVGDYVLSRP